MKPMLPPALSVSAKKWYLSPGDGAKQYQIKPVLAGRFEYGVDYTGSITFGIEVVDVQ